MSYQDFTQFRAWQNGPWIILEIFQLTKKLPHEERFALISDMRRAAYSNTNNIAAGFGRFEKKDKTRFYKFSCGSAYELSNPLHICYAVSYINIKTQKSLGDSLKKIIHELNKLIKTLEST
jgi:four helix bundle protein